MAVDPNLSLKTGTLNTSDPLYQAQTQQNENAMAAQKILQNQYATMDAREKSRLYSVISGAAQLKVFLDNEDLGGAYDFLARRRGSLQNRIGSGEAIDTEDTDAAIEMLKTGNVEELKRNIQGLMAAGEIYGIINPSQSAGGDTGVLVNRLIKEGSAKNVQEALQLIKGGAGQAGKNLADINTGFDANYATQSGKNASDIEAAAPKARNEALGKKAGETVIDNNKTLNSLGDLQFSIQQARELLPRVAMTGPIAGRVGNLSEDPDYKNLQGAINAITLQAKDLYNLGSGAGFTDADREFLRDVVAGKYARAETIEAGLARFEQALQNRQRNLSNQNTQYGQGNYNYNTQQQPKQPAGKIRVVNPQTGEAFEIDAEDLPAAQAEGFQQQ